jgi:phosphatidylethanolamine-binding protein (PEBP) family uncharacterized protein
MEKISFRKSLSGVECGICNHYGFQSFRKILLLIHPWIIWNIPPVLKIPHGIPHKRIVNFPFSAVQGIADYMTIGYACHCSPHGQMIRNQFKEYGLNVILDLSAKSNKHELVSAMQGHVIPFGEKVVIYSR